MRAAHSSWQVEHLQFGKQGLQQADEGALIKDLRMCCTRSVVVKAQVRVSDSAWCLKGQLMLHHWMHAALPLTVSTALHLPAQGCLTRSKSCASTSDRWRPWWDAEPGLEAVAAREGGCSWWTASRVLRSARLVCTCTGSPRRMAKYLQPTLSLWFCGSALHFHSTFHSTFPSLMGAQVSQVGLHMHRQPQADCQVPAARGAVDLVVRLCTAH